MAKNVYMHLEFASGPDGGSKREAGQKREAAASMTEGKKDKMELGNTWCREARTGFTPKITLARDLRSC